MLNISKKNIFTKSVSNAFITVLILWFLTKRDYHGYSLMKKIDEFFDVQINTGLTHKTQANKIYPLLKKLEENDLIESYEGTHKKKKVKLYKLTEDGLKLHNFNKFISNQNSKINYGLNSTLNSLFKTIFNFHQFLSFH